MQNLRLVQTCANMHAEQEQQTRQYHPGLLYEYGVRPEQRERLVYLFPNLKADARKMFRKVDREVEAASNQPHDSQSAARPCLLEVERPGIYHTLC